MGTNLLLAFWQQNNLRNLEKKTNKEILKFRSSIIVVSARKIIPMLASFKINKLKLSYLKSAKSPIFVAKTSSLPSLCFTNLENKTPKLEEIRV